MRKINGGVMMGNDRIDSPEKYQICGERGSSWLMGGLSDCVR